MHLLYCDETNLQPNAGDFFVYGGIAIDGDAALSLSSSIDLIRTNAKIDRSFRLKFLPKPENLTHQEFIAVKEAVINTAIEHKAIFLVSVILHDIATNAEEARRNEINRVCYHFDCILNRFKDAGLVLIDRFTDAQIDEHLAAKFSIGITGLPYSPEHRLGNVVGFHYSAIGQAHFTSLIDIVLGSLRFSINAFTKNDAARMDTARLLMGKISPLFFRQDDGRVSELSFFFSPKIIKVEKYRARYEALKAFLESVGIKTAQDITEVRRY